MSSLRKHLEAERNAHQEIRYPGNLGREILPMPVISYGQKRSITRSPWFLIFGSLAAAALVAVALPVWHRLMSPVTKVAEVQPTYQPSQDDEEMPFVLDTTESMPADVPIVPTANETMTPDYQSMSFPSVPSFSDTSTNDDTTTQTSQEST